MSHHLQTIRRMLKPATRPVGRLAERWIDRVICRATGMRAMSDLDAQDVFIVGYPKSGNTWFQFLSAGALYGADPQYLPRPLVAILTPDVHANRVYRRHGAPMCFKSHALPQPEYRRVVYLIRDGRDAMVSYYHYLTGLQGGRPPDFARMVTEGEGLFPGKWHEHVEAWTANPHGAEMLVIRYEDLLSDGVGQLERFCAFVGIERERELLEKVAQNSTFRKLSAREKAGERASEKGPWDREATFFRKGKSGAWASEMPEAIQEAFLAEAEPMMRRYGYL